MDKKSLLVLPVVVIFSVLMLPKYVMAHCPLCTVGAAAVAGGAAYLGVSSIVIGIFIGAFAVAIGWWVARVIKRRFIPYQRSVIIAFSFIATILPMMPFFSASFPLYLAWLGEYGSVFMINMFLIGSFIGGFIVSVTPWVSKKMTFVRNGKMIPFQGIMLTLGLLIIVGSIIQIMV